ncbi:MAG TPA: EAL domain-containing protein [Noviherbaspirillum sp.]|uniref:EAL domain-containing protein n=1 Tax=Noviherbaspirillum sp. TaxID=1926288 RepID=UPI002B46E1EA|nr:EAL domain-containing protein [Noviherbaspirillum sp.]HJV86072.1 EAL domain-containing protein [Noviherbaspirillum sp.]
MMDKKAIASLDFQKIFESTPSPCLILGPDLRIIAANKAYRQATHTEGVPIFARHIFEVFPENPSDPKSNSVARLRASLERVLTKKKPDTMPLQKYDIPTPGGEFEERHWSPVNVPVLDEDGVISCIIHRVEDVTDLVKNPPQGAGDMRAEALAVELFRRGREIEAMNTRLREANDALARLDKSKTDFFNDVSHEFRTPLTLLLWSLEQMQRSGEQSEPARQKALATATRNAKRMLHLVNTLLDFARADSGRIRAKYQPTNLVSFTNDLASQFRTAVEQAGLRFSIESQPLQEPVYIDREMWEKIVLNLLSNAFKFTKQGEIQVQLKERNGRAELTVRDTGSGISPEDLPMVFDRFFRAKGAAARGEDGTGIGLALVKELVHLHGGDVHVESTVGKGSTFTVEIPLGCTHLPASSVLEDASANDSWQANSYVEEIKHWIDETDTETHNEPSVPGATKERASVLVVDDNVDLGNYIARLLGERFETQTETVGARALESVYQKPPDVLVTDLLMSGLGGLDLVRAIRTDPMVSALPIIIVSGKADDEQRSIALEAGADDFLVKPFSARELLARVTILVEQAARNRHERTLRAEAEAARTRMRMVLESVSEAFIAVDRQWRITYVNGKAAHLLESAVEDLIQKPLGEFFPDSMQGDLRIALQHAMGQRRTAQLEYVRNERWWNIGIFPSPEGLVMLASEITERKEAEERMRHMAHHDPLTGLHNRASLFEFGGLLLAATRRSGKMLATLFIDLDRFKSINDTYGHDMGDQLLQQLGQRLRHALRGEDLMARLGGDEFLAVLPNLNSATDAAHIATNLLEQLRQPYWIGDTELYCSPSIGISLFPQDGQSLDVLIQNADVAMYQAKDSGRNNYHFYTMSPSDRTPVALSIEQRLRRGVQGQGFQVFYQPILDASTGSLSGAEALLRWPQPPDVQAIGPDLFIPIAESVGVIQPLGQWVFEEVCRQLHEWRENGVPPLSVAVNVSAIQFRHRDFLPALIHILRDTCVDPECITLEVTESALMTNIDESVKALSTLRDAGVSVALDDFGTGYSSLSQLARLPLDKLKIDRAFVKSIKHGGPGPAIVEAIIALGRTLNLKVVAEGVETKSDLKFLRERNCHQVQGFLIGRPMPGVNFIDWWNKRAASKP